MADKRDYYEVLGVSKTATDAEIKKAFDQNEIEIPFPQLDIHLKDANANETR